VAAIALISEELRGNTTDFRTSKIFYQEGNNMAWGQPLGLDELMIINPTSSPDAYLLGEDGTLYQVQGLAQEQFSSDLGASDTGQYFLGEDGTLYQLQGAGLGDSFQAPMQPFARPHTCRCMRQ
jgi:hypothetical protein